MHIVGTVYFSHKLHLSISSRKINDAAPQETCFIKQSKYKYDMLT